MNHRKQRLLVFSLPVLLTFVSLGCGLSNVLTEQDEPTPTRTAMPTFTPTVAGEAFVQVDVADAQAQAEQEQAALQEPPTATPVPVEPTEVPTEPPPPPTDTPAPKAPSVTILQNMNVRGGPGTNYPVIGAGPAGATTKITGRNNDNSWVQVEYPSDDGVGWVYADLVQIDGDLSQVEVASAPPPPAPVAQAPAPEPEAPQEEAPPPPPPEPKYQFTPTGWHASENAGIAQFKGRLRDEGGNLVNGFSILASNGSFSVLSRPSGSNPWFPDVGPGEWDVVLPNIHTAQGWWWLTVVNYECNFWGGFDALCTNFTRLSEDVKVQIASPAESIINADWVCHWDCNKGLYVSCQNDRGKVTCQ